MLGRADDHKRVDADQPVSVQRRLSSVPSPSDGGELHHLLDSLIALRLEFANDTDGQRALVDSFGRTALVRVRKILDTAIENIKVVIETTDHPEQSKSPSAQTPLIEERIAGKRLD